MIASLLAAAGETVVQTAAARSAAEGEAGWVVSCEPAASPSPLDMVVFTPIMPAATQAGEVAQQICHGLPEAAIAVSAPQRESAMDVLRERFPGLIEVAQRCRLSRGRADLDGQEFRLKTAANEYRVTLPVLGVFQIENAATAVLAVEQLAKPPIAITAKTVSTGFSSLRLPGRLEVLKRQPEVIIDSCSNLGSLRRAMESIQELARGRRLLVVLALGAGLDPGAAVGLLAQHAAELFLAPIVDPALQRELQDCCYETGASLQFHGDIAACVDQALSSAASGDAIAVVGSADAAATARSLVLGLMPPEGGLHYTG
jgi:dihydrofolate synthase/folylpolyglutamate synthase